MGPENPCIKKKFKKIIFDPISVPFKNVTFSLFNAFPRVPHILFFIQNGANSNLDEKLFGTPTPPLSTVCLVGKGEGEGEQGGGGGGEAGERGPHTRPGDQA